MNVSKSNIKKIIKKFNQQTNDVDRFEIIISNSQYFGMFLDNDYTAVYLTDIAAKNLTDDDFEKSSYQLNELDEYLGQTEGVMNLLSSIGIEFELA